MAIFDNFPYTNIHDLNLDWIIKSVKSVKDKTDVIEQIGEEIHQWATDAENSAVSAENSVNTIKSLVVTPEMMGAVGDGVTDDTVAFKDAITFAINNKCHLYAQNTYLISDTLAINYTDDDAKIFWIDGEIITDFNHKPVITFQGCHNWIININARNSDNTRYYGNYRFNTGTALRYGLLPNVGIILSGCDRCLVCGSLKNFNVGLRLGGLGGGTVYNNIARLSVWNCAYGIELYATGSSDYANQNYFTDIHVSVNSGIPNRDKTVPVHIFSLNNSYPNNCNTFSGDFMTENNTGYMAVIENGTYNKFTVRNEGSHKVAVDNGDYNEFVTQYNTTSITPTGPASTYSNAVTEMLKNYDKLCDVQYENIDIVYHKSSGAYYAASCDKLDYGQVISNVFEKEYYIYNASQIATNDGFIPAQFGVMVKLNDNHDLVFKLTNDANADIRASMYLFDANMDVLLTPLDYIEHSYNASFTMSVAGRASATANSNKALVGATFSDDVKYVFIFASANYSRITVYAKHLYDGVNTAKQSFIIRTLAYHVPYMPITNTTIISKNKFIGKRLYSTSSGTEYKCTAIDAQGVETWS